jgi:hypothetical protein
MQINHQQSPGKTIRNLLAAVLLIAALLPLVLVGAENETVVDNKPAATDTSQPGSVEEQDGPVEPAQPDSETPPGTGKDPRPVKEFKPTDKIGADSAVSFPIDI